MSKYTQTKAKDFSSQLPHEKLCKMSTYINSIFWSESNNSQMQNLLVNVILVKELYTWELAAVWWFGLPESIGKNITINYYSMLEVHPYNTTL